MAMRASAAGPLPRGRSEVRAVGDAEAVPGQPYITLRGPPPELGGNPEAMRVHMNSLEASRDEHEKLRERIMSLEESLQRLGRESLERAKIGMEKLAEKYFPKVKQYEALNVSTPPPIGQGPLLRVPMKPMQVKVVGPMPGVAAQPMPGSALRTSMSPSRPQLASPRSLPVRSLSGHCSPGPAAP